MSDQPSSHTEYWLYEFQKLATNVNGMVSRGQSERAMREIEATWERWRESCAVKANVAFCTNCQAFRPEGHACE